MNHSEKILADSETKIAQILRIGVYLSGSIVLVGLFMGLPSQEQITELLSGRIIEDTVPKSVEQFTVQLPAFDSQAIISLGLLSLIALPIIRVAFTVYLFFRQKDWVYCCITLFVLTVLIFSLSLGHSL